jgi:hypothetical protein
MLGNLSKVLIKAPLFFNNKTQIKRKNTLQKIPEENILDPFYQINHIKKRGNSLSSIYFKERDFWRKNLKLDINFNNNKRLHKYDFHSLDVDLDKEQNEQNIIFLDNNNSNKNDDFNKNKRYFNYTSESPIKTSKGRNKNVNNYKKIFLLQKDNNNLNDSDISLKSDERMKSFLNTENNNIKKDNSSHINSCKNNINTNEENININNFENANNIKGRNRFPKISKTFKSQDSLFQDNIDQRLISLISVKPEIKEQYKSINRNMVGQRDYFVYQKSGRFDYPNPFYESINKKEELFNIIDSKKNKNWQ